MTEASNEKMNILEIIENKNTVGHFVCEHTSSEITTLCPFSGNPDFYSLFLQYEPHEKLIELKSLKLYLTSYRNERLIHEDLLNRIFRDLKDTIEPRWMYIELLVNVRGGISTSVRRFWSKEGDKDNIEMAILKGREQ